METVTPGSGDPSVVTRPRTVCAASGSAKKTASSTTQRSFCMCTPFDFLDEFGCEYISGVRRLAAAFIAAACRGAGGKPPASERRRAAAVQNDRQEFLSQIHQLLFADSVNLRELRKRAR